MFVFPCRSPLCRSQYTDQIQKQFEDTDITLSAITLLSPELKGQLSSFSGKANNLNSTAITQQVGVIHGLTCICVHFYCTSM